MTVRKVVEVPCCEVCVFSQYEDEGSFSCNWPDDDSDGVTVRHLSENKPWGWRPDWCPLETTEVLVRLKR